MALTTVTITITNTKTNPTVIDGKQVFAPISPTLVSVPDTPYTEYLSDSATVNDGTIFVPLFNRTQICKLPAGGILTLETENYNEAAYYSTLEVEGANISVSADPIQIVSVTFDKATAAITGTGTASITATTNPAGQTVTWKSSDTSVATVSSGTVQGVAPGTATITGSIDVNGAKASATCVVTVS